MDQLKIGEWVKKYRYVLLILIAGVVLMLLPEQLPEQEQPTVQDVETENMETRLETGEGKQRGRGLFRFTEEEQGIFPFSLAFPRAIRFGFRSWKCGGGRRHFQLGPK